VLQAVAVAQAEQEQEQVQTKHQQLQQQSTKAVVVVVELTMVVDQAANPTLSGAAGGSGFVGIVDPKGSLVASSCWDLRSVFKQKVAGTWY
jgi:hypothetical protein